MNHDDVTHVHQTADGKDLAVDGGESHVPHSGLGMASFIIAMSCFALVVAVTALALATGSDDPLAAPGLGAVLAVAMTILNLAPLVGIGLGIAGLFAGMRRRTYAALGLAFNGIMIAIMILVWRAGRA